MKNQLRSLLPILLITVLFSACRVDPPPSTSTAPAAAPTASGSHEAKERVVAKNRLAPDELFGNLFRRVQMERVFADGKTFVDMVPKRNASDIMMDYGLEEKAETFDLKAFVEKNFDPPMQPVSGFSSDGKRSITEHINTLWPVLTRKAGADEGTSGSLIPLPNDYVVPGGRFREVYYWDSYFTLLGLQAAEKGGLVRDMVENFAYLLDEVGHIPNGNRTYYLTRSQPPFFSLMVEVLAEMEGEEVYNEFLPQLKKEWKFWMDGMKAIKNGSPTSGHVVLMPDSSWLNRYYDAGDRPRAESYREDVLAIRESGRDSQTVARHLRSGAESGWDYSARWFADGENISSIITTDIVPPDLNSLMLKLERTIARAEKGSPDRRSVWNKLADRRLKSMNTYLWDEKTGFYQDYNWKTNQHTNFLSLAGVYPLFVGEANPSQALKVSQLLEAKFLASGGLRTSLVDTDQQWDAPNGWPPLQWMSYAGLKAYGQTALASKVRKRWMANNERVYANVHKMVEKYNVEDITLEAGGGEYPVQDGFGWSNGVYLRMEVEVRN